MFRRYECCIKSVYGRRHRGYSYHEDDSELLEKLKAAVDVSQEKYIFVSTERRTVKCRA